MHLVSFYSIVVLAICASRVLSLFVLSGVLIDHATHVRQLCCPEKSCRCLGFDKSMNRYRYLFGRSYPALKLFFVRTWKKLVIILHAGFQFCWEHQDICFLVISMEMPLWTRGTEEPDFSELSEHCGMMGLGFAGVLTASSHCIRNWQRQDNKYDLMSVCFDMFVWRLDM